MKIGKLVIDPKDLEVRHWQNFVIDPIKGKNALRTMKRGCKILEKTGINYWISSGNLLGLYRDKKLISHDTDIDANASLKWNSLEANILSKQVVLGLTANDFQIIRTIVYKNHFMQLASMDMKTQVIFDVNFFYTGICPRYAVHLDTEGYILKPVKFINDLGTLEYRGTVYLIPNHIEEFLAWRYGKDWRTPKKHKEPWQSEAINLRRYL